MSFSSDNRKTIEAFCLEVVCYLMRCSLETVSPALAVYASLQTHAPEHMYSKIRRWIRQ